MTCQILGIKIADTCMRLHPSLVSVQRDCRLVHCQVGSSSSSLPPRPLPLSRQWPSTAAARGYRQPSVRGTGRTLTRLVRGAPEGRPAGIAESEEILTPDSVPGGTGLVGEDAARFEIAEQSVKSWGAFFAVLAVVLAALYVLWIDPATGWGGAYIDFFLSVTSSSEAAMLAILLAFAIVHSGGAALRRTAEGIVGERVYRVIFAGISLPLAVSAVVFFINHRYDGVQLWQLRTVPGMHELVWALSFISFFFLYPSTFNLLEVAAVDKPKVHMWETGVMRITRHPQLLGQVVWCVAHTLWIGNSFMVATSLGLAAHHVFGAWHGDQRLAARYGEAFEQVKARTSILPFAAIMDGRQKLPADYYREFLRAPYFAIIGVTVGAYLCHPLMQQASFWLHW